MSLRIQPWNWAYLSTGTIILTLFHCIINWIFYSMLFSIQYIFIFRSLLLLWQQQILWIIYSRNPITFLKTFVSLLLVVGVRSSSLLGVRPIQGCLRWASQRRNLPARHQPRRAPPRVPLAPTPPPINITTLAQIADRLGILHMLHRFNHLYSLGGCHQVKIQWRDLAVFMGRGVGWVAGLRVYLNRGNNRCFFSEKMLCCPRSVQGGGGCALWATWELRWFWRLGA